MPGRADDQPGRVTPRKGPAYLTPGNGRTVVVMTSAPPTAPAPTETALPLKAGRWKLDPTHSSITLSIRHLGLASVQGRFNTFDAWIEVGGSLSTTTVEAEIDLASIDTGLADRDDHLRSEGFLDVVNHPQMRLVSTSLSGAGRQWRMDGELTVKDKVSPFGFDLQYTGTEPLPREITDSLGLGPTRHAGFNVEGELVRSQVGLDFALPPALGGMLSDTVRFELQLEFVEPS
jgi:polyisoprenoid-binding protein YceI